MQVIVDGLLTQYERFGDQSKPAMLLLHGWADSSASWRAIAQKLASNYDILLLNLPGFGGTARPQTAWGLDDYAHFAEAFISKMGLQVQILIGHSNGGAIAIRAVGSGYIQPARLVLLASAGIRNQDKGRKNVLRYITKAGKMLTMPLPAGAKKQLRSRLYSSVGSDLLVAEGMEDTFRRVVAEDVLEDAALITIPTLLLYGESDTAAPALYGRIFHESMPNSTLEILPSVGHFLQLDAPEKVVHLILEFSKDV